jgi:uncharacterized OsmC-like protein
MALTQIKVKRWRDAVWHACKRRKAVAGLEYLVSSRFADGSGVARCKEAEVPLDAALDPRLDAFNPAELLLAAVAACMTKSTLRAAQMNGFEVRAVEVRLKGTRQDSPPRMARIEYELLLDTDEADRRLELIHRNVLKFGTVTSTVAGATEFVGRIGRLARDERPAQVSGAAPSATASSRWRGSGGGGGRRGGAAGR